MKTYQATDAKNRFGEMLEDAGNEPVVIQKNGRDVAVVLSKAEYDRSLRAASKRELVKKYHEESIKKYDALYEELAK